MQEQIGYRLPDVQTKQKVKGDESELVVEQPIHVRVKELQQRLQNENGSACEHEIADAGSNEFAPLGTHPRVPRDITHRESLRVPVARVKTIEPTHKHWDHARNLPPALPGKSL